MGQIETAEAVMWAEGLCGVKGIDAIFLGLGDLSASMGLTGETRHPKVFEAADRVIKIAKERNKLVAVAGAPSDAGMWRQKGADILFCTSDIMCLRLGLKAVKDDVTNSLEG
jgi:2-keto-3-deoxy-L-rhamnonate aldolase RhmA